MITNKYYRNVSFLFSLLSFSIILNLVVFDLVGFKLWSQVTYLFDTGFPLSKVLSHPHGPRYLLTYPIFYLSSLIGVDVNVIFSILACFLISSIIYINLMSCYFFFDGTEKKVLIVGFSVFSFYMLLSLSMNGRIIFAMLGASLFVNIALYKPSIFKFYIYSFISILLAAVSSGTITIVFAWFLSYYLFFHTKSYVEKVLGYISVLSFIYLISDFVILYINKNLDFFHGSFYKMMTHGLGSYVQGDMVIMALKISNLVSVLAIVVMFEFIRDKLTLESIDYMLYVFFCIALVIGIFGISSATMLCPVIFLLLVKRFLVLRYDPLS